eukprot:c17902_g1_i1 orf=424-630(-)
MYYDFNLSVSFHDFCAGRQIFVILVLCCNYEDHVSGWISHGDTMFQVFPDIRGIKKSGKSFIRKHCKY